MSMAAMAARMLRPGVVSVAPHVSSVSVTSATVLQQLPRTRWESGLRCASSPARLPAQAGESSVRRVLFQSPVLNLTSSHKMVSGIMSPLQVRAAGSVEKFRGGFMYNYEPDPDDEEEDDNFGVRKEEKTNPFDRRGKPKEFIGSDNVEKMPIIKVLYMNRVTVVRKKGKVVRNQAIVAVGNGKGLCGIGKAKDPIAANAIEKATKRAHRFRGATQPASLREEADGSDRHKNLHYFELYDNRTVWHDWFQTYKRTRLVMLASKEGLGLRVNSTIAAICECIGIKDLQVKVNGSRNRHNMVNAFWMALCSLESPEEVARKRGKVVIDYASLRAGLGRGHTTLPADFFR